MKSHDQSKDDSHQRWDNQSTADQFIWKYYDEIASKELIHECINKSDISLAELYQRLALLRAECEWVKKYVKKNDIQNLDHDVIKDIVKNNIISEFPGEFASFQPGGTIEVDIHKLWGESIATLGLKRHQQSTNSIHGLSAASYKTDNDQLDIIHPDGYMLLKLEQDFQKLLITDNLFDYLVLASRLTYTVSNFPPIKRGSASVNTWLIDKIAQEKFNIKTSIRPFLYDWIAFYESPAQYTNFYVISSATAYIKSLGKIDEINDFEQKLKKLMMEDPNDIKILSDRKALWNELKNIINIALKNNPDLDQSEIQKLNEIASGQLEFIKLPEKSDRLITAFLQTQNKEEVNDLFNTLTSADKDYIKEKFFEYKYKSTNAILFKRLDDYNNTFDAPEKEKKFNLEIAEYDAFSHLFQTNKVVSEFFTTAGLYDDNEIRDAMHQCVIDQNNYEDLFQDQLRLLTDSIDHPVCKWGFIEPDILSKYEELLMLSSASQNISLALKNSVTLNEVNDAFSVIQSKFKDKQDQESMISALTSMPAIMLYKTSSDIHIKDLIKATVKETELNILRLSSESKMLIPEDKTETKILVSHSIFANTESGAKQTEIKEKPSNQPK